MNIKEQLVLQQQDQQHLLKDQIQNLKLGPQTYPTWEEGIRSVIGTGVNPSSSLTNNIERYTTHSALNTSNQYYTASNLETLINSVAQTSFKFGAVDKFVAVDRERSSFSYGLKTWEAGGPNSLAERSGLCTLTLIEKVAS